MTRGLNSESGSFIIIIIVVARTRVLIGLAPFSFALYRDASLELIRPESLI